MRVSFMVQVWFVFVLLWVGILGEYTHCKKVDNNVNYKLYWDLSTAGKIKFMVQAETAGWLGLGLSTGGDHPMISNGARSDVWVGWVSTNSSSNCRSGCVYDYSVDMYQQPSLDPPSSQSLTLISGKYEEGVTTLEYERDLDTKDEVYDRVIQTDSSTTFIWALNPSSWAVPPDDGSVFWKHNADTKGVFSVKLNAPSSCLDAPTSRYSFSNEDGTYTAWWVMDGNDAIKFTITAQTKGWVGIGFSTSDSMIDADVYVGWIDKNGNAVMTDRYASAHSMPKEDTALGGENSVLRVASAGDGDDYITSITFSRPLEAKDKYDVAISDAPMYVLWAYGDDDSVNYDQNTFKKHKARGVITAELITGATEPALVMPTRLLFQIHGLFMLVAFCLLLFPGMLVSRYFKALIPRWIHVHMMSQTLGMLALIIGSIIAFVAKNNTVVMDTHQIMGFIALGVYVLQFVIGLFSHFVKPKKPSATAPIWPQQIHWYLGWGLAIWTVITMYFGLRAYGVSTVVNSVFAVWVGTALAAVLALQSMIGQSEDLTKNKYVNVELADTSSSMTSSSSTAGDMAEEEEPDTETDKKHAKKSKDENANTAKTNTRAKLVLYGLLAATVLCIIVGIVMERREMDNSNIIPPPNDSPPVNSDSFVMNYQFGDYVIPNKSTNYICKGFYMPNDTDYHVIAFEPIKDNQEFLHHMILYETESFTGEKYFDCSSMPKGSTPLFTWAVGGQARTLPPNVGFRIGKNAGKFTALQIHYDNPNHWSGRTDSSGVKLTLTTKIREMDAGYFVTGVSTKNISIPAGQNYFEITGYCDTAAQIFKKGNFLPEYKFITSGLHMHMTGFQAYTEQFRNSSGSESNEVSLGNVACDDFFSFNNQHGESTNATLRPGDKFITHCMYDTSSRTTVTKGCEETSCEMCLNFMIYYPKIPNTTLLSCGSNAIISKNTEKTLHCK